ncbi:MAG TPA: CCA tRNA nucleotidyltransferase [Haloplasmataceae bacterium]
MSNVLKAKEIMKELHKRGYEAYIVGGYVRDLLLGIENQDIDIATNALPSDIKNIFPKTILTGEKHGTVTVIYDNSHFEITTYRTDGNYLDNRKPESVHFISSLQEDLKRRDFTMNALALTIDEQIIDYVDGKKAIEEKLIKTVGNPDERFHEDALRMLRAFRFVSSLGFSIESIALTAISKNAYLLKNISMERILQELEKTVLGPYFLKACDLMIESKFYKSLPPFSKGLEKIYSTKFKPDNLLEFLIFCAVVDDLDAILNLPIANNMKRVINIVYEMVKLEIRDFTKPILYRNGLENCLIANKINVHLYNHPDLYEKIKNDYESLPIHKPCDLQFKGDNIIQLYTKKPGAWISEIIDDITLKVLNGILENDYQVLKNYVLNVYQDK